jgi:hypothetical protein
MEWWKISAWRMRTWRQRSSCKRVWVQLVGVLRKMHRVEKLLDGMTMLGWPMKVDEDSIKLRQPLRMLMACSNSRKLKCVVRRCLRRQHHLQLKCGVRR